MSGRCPKARNSRHNRPPLRPEPIPRFGPWASASCGRGRYRTSACRGGSPGPSPGKGGPPTAPRIGRGSPRNQALPPSPGSPGPSPATGRRCRCAPPPRGGRKRPSPRALPGTSGRRAHRSAGENRPYRARRCSNRPGWSASRRCSGRPGPQGKLPRTPAPPAPPACRSGPGRSPGQSAGKAPPRQDNEAGRPTPSPPPSPPHRCRSARKRSNSSPEGFLRRPSYRTAPPLRRTPAA